LNNQLLVALSCPDATLVAGFRAWLSMGLVDSRVDRFESFPRRASSPEVGEPARLRQLGPTIATVGVLDPCGCVLDAVASIVRSGAPTPSGVGE
jgi:hypothetical protein